MAFTVQQIALRMLKYIGVTQLTPQPAGSELEDVTDNDLDEVAACISGAMQEIHEKQPVENMEQDGGGLLHAPTTVSLTATNGSKAISAVTTWAAWMAGCTVRIGGDDQDNEFISSTLLARPYMGTTGSGKASVVYGDCLTLAATESRALAPISLPNQLPLTLCDTLETFLRLAGWPAIVGLDGSAWSSPFFYYVRKSVGRPSVVLPQGAYDSSLSYVPRRLRFAPLPDQAYPVGYRVVATAPRYTRADIISQLISLVGSGAESGPNLNQAYVYFTDIGGYRMFRGGSVTTCSIYFCPSVGRYIAAETISFAPPPANYWAADLATSPLGTYTPAGAATGTFTVVIGDGPSGGAETDPGIVVPLVDDAVESILLPMAMQRFTGAACFKNESAKKEIARQHLVAIDKLRNSRVLGAPRNMGYR